MSANNMHVHIQEGMWVHKTQEKSPAIDVTGVDQHRGIVYIGSLDTYEEPKTMSIDDLLNNYMQISLEANIMGGKVKQQNSLLGGLDKEGDVPRVENTEEQGEELLDDVSKSTDIVMTPITPSINVSVDINSAEYRMIADAIKLSEGNDSLYNGDVDVKFDFDIDKIANVAKMFNIDSSKVADVVLSTDLGVETLKAVFVAILEKVIEK